ncbi:DUF2279 domain-containing protein [bacterium]|nr:DUF2279 domain-containing protein [bacterium]
MTPNWVFKAGLLAAACAAALAVPSAAGEARAAEADSCAVIRGGDSWFGADKARHFTASFLLTGAVSRTLHVHGHENRSRSLAAGVAFTVSLGGLKELLDRTGRGHASWKDMAANLLGAGCGVLLVAWW